MESYVPIHEDEVGFMAGEEVQVITKSMDGWWEIRCGQGIFFVCIQFTLSSPHLQGWIPPKNFKIV